MTTPFRELTPAQAHAELGRYRVIDVREAYEFHGPLGFIERAELLPLSSVADNADMLAGSEPLLIVCRSGRRSGKACETLQGSGVGDATNLAEGMIGWHHAGLPVRYTEPKTLTQLLDQVVAWAVQVGLFSAEAAPGVVGERLEHRGASLEEPSHSAVEDLIRFVGESLSTIDPPDLELSLEAFRRSLATL